MEKGKSTVPLNTFLDMGQRTVCYGVVGTGRARVHKNGPADPASIRKEGMIEPQKLLKADAVQNASDLPGAGRCRARDFRRM